jgi:glyoxylase-like metal-dependent hydrolase (beta-lactamase superfamily II)
LPTTITILGCSGGIGPDLRTTGLLVGEDTLIDAGTGVGDLSLDAQRRIRRVLLTHAHLDHVCGLALMADNLFDEISAPVEVYGRPETLQTLRDHLFNWQLWPDFAVLPSVEAPLLRWQPQPVGSRTPLGGGLQAQSFAVAHTVPAVGYVLRGASQCFVFTGDTFHSAELWAPLNALPRLDYLMVEIAFRNEEAGLGEIARHFTPARLAESLAGLRHRPKLLLTHHKPGEEAVIAEQCVEALAGWQYRHLRLERRPARRC